MSRRQSSKKYGHLLELSQLHNIQPKLAKPLNEKDQTSCTHLPILVDKPGIYEIWLKVAFGNLFQIRQIWRRMTNKLPNYTQN
jgi:hypothetical protein